MSNTSNSPFGSLATLGVLPRLVERYYLDDPAVTEEDEKGESFDEEHRERELILVSRLGRGVDANTVSFKRVGPAVPDEEFEIVVVEVGESAEFLPEVILVERLEEEPEVTVDRC